MFQLGIIELDPSRRQLKVRGQTVRLSARAFDILEILLRAGGAVVPKEELFRRVWPGLVVEENNLQVQISAVRKALGDDREGIQTVPKRGYRLMVERLVDATGTKVPVVDAGLSSPLTNLPFPVSEIIGRERFIEEIVAMLGGRKIVTLTGPGGIGKTRLSLEVGRRALPCFPDGVWLAELGSLTTPLLVADSIGNALGARIGNHASRFDTIVEVIGARRLLLVLDNCEHLIEEIAQLVECVAQAVPHACILTTSREPLGVHGEAVAAVPSLSVTKEDGANAAEPDAVVLFLSRMRSLSVVVPYEERSLGFVRALCRRLDGIPLAIEIAAAWAPVLGVEQLSARLDDRFRLLMGGKRTAVARHRTLAATLDWSFDLLGEVERGMLCSFAIFAGGFTLDAALALCPSNMSVALAIGVVTTLVRKSLIVVDTDELGARYRLLETTRAYLVQKLHKRGDWDRVAKRHATFFAQLLRTAQTDPGSERREDQFRFYRRELDNVRAAIDWAFMDGRERAIGLSLAANTAPLMFDFSLLEECEALAERALDQFAQSGEAHAEVELTLLGMRAAAMVYTHGPTEEVAVAWHRVRVVAMQLGESVALWRATWGIWNQKIYAGEPEASLPFAQQFVSVDTPYAEATGLIEHRMFGIIDHLLGNQPEARDHLEQVVSRYDHSVHYIPVIGSRFDHGRAARVTLTRVLCLQGDLDRATALNLLITSDSERASPPLLMCFALLDAAIPVALMLQQWQKAKQHCDELQRRFAITRVPIWEGCAECFAELVAIRLDRAPARFAVLRAKIERLRETHFLTHLTWILCLMAEELGLAAQPAEGLGVVNEALRICERTGERWCFPELLRVRGELTILCGGECAAEAAERDFLSGIELSRTQGALLWELRIARSLARLWCGSDRVDDARLQLRQVYDRFTGGVDTPDLTVTRAMLRSLEG